MLYKANDLYSAVLTQGYTVGDTTLYVDTVPTLVPTIVTVSKGTTDETQFIVTNRTTNTLTGVSRLKGANRNLDIGSAVTCLNNSEFINQFVSVSGWVTETYGATVTFDLDDGAKQRVILTGDATFALSNVSDGKIFHLRVTQDATGGRTVTWFDGISWDDGVEPTLSGANKTDTFLFIQTGTGTYDGYVTGSNK